MIIGITGPSGSGKTTVANFIGEHTGGIVIHGDDLAHEVLTLEIYTHVLKWFNINNESSTVNRKYLGQLLFQNKEMMARYNALIYELIQKRIQSILSTGHHLYIIDWNFLPITPYMEISDITILLTCSQEERERRVIKRDNISSEYFQNRENHGLTYNEEEFDYVIDSKTIMDNPEILKEILKKNKKLEMRNN